MTGVVLLAGWIIAGAITALALGCLFRWAGWGAASDLDWPGLRDGKGRTL